MLIVFDIDGTLSLVGDRLKYLKDKDWDSFYEACGEDGVNSAIMDLATELNDAEHTIVCVTGRRESVRDKTLRWLSKHGLFIDNLYMRKDGDYRHDTEVKLELVKDFIDDIDLVFEDRASMVQAWRDAGITCCQVAEGDF
jgi:uncharacterized HAD superfamily protein